MLLATWPRSGLQNASTGGEVEAGSLGKTRERNPYQCYRSPGKLDGTRICAENHSGRSKDWMFYHNKAEKGKYVIISVKASVQTTLLVWSSKKSRRSSQTIPLWYRNLLRGPTEEQKANIKSTRFGHDTFHQRLHLQVIWDKMKNLSAQGF